MRSAMTMVTMDLPEHTGFQVESAPEGRMTRISSLGMTAVERERGRMEEGKEKE